jgi:hypothetical protein
MVYSERACSRLINNRRIDKAGPQERLAELTPVAYEVTKIHYSVMPTLSGGFR